MVSEGFWVSAFVHCAVRLAVGSADAFINKAGCLVL